MDLVSNLKEKVLYLSPLCKSLTDVYIPEFSIQNGITPSQTDIGVT